MKRKFPWIVFWLLIILNLLNVILFSVGVIDSSGDTIETIAGSLLIAVLSQILFGALFYLILPAFIYFMLSREDSKKNRVGYIASIVTLILQIVFSGPTWLLIALLCSEGADYWIAFIYYILGALLTIVAIIYAKKYLKLKVFKPQKS